MNDSTGDDALARLVRRQEQRHPISKPFAYERARREIDAGIRLVCTLGAQVSPEAAICCLRTADSWCVRCSAPRCADHAQPCPACGWVTIPLPKGPSK